MKIISLEAENLKKLTAVQITPEGNLVQITGRNGQGKTSVLDAIWWALDGSKNVQTTPIRQGEQKATIRLDLGQLIITRRFNAQEDGTFTTSITVENGDGARFSSPQKMLDDLLGELTFDPLAFTRMKDADQVMALRSLVPDFDFDRAEEDVKTAYARRTEYNRDANMAKAEAESIERDLPAEILSPVDVTKLTADLRKAQEHNAHADDMARKYREAAAKVEGIGEKIDQLSSEIERLKSVKSERRKEAEEYSKAIAEKTDTMPIMQAIENAAETNKAAAAAQKAKDMRARSDHAAEQSQKLTDSINKIKADAEAAIANANMPIEGLGILDGKVHLDSVPFDQASDAQQLQASIGIAMALNPKLKVIRVRDGSLLDDEAMKVLADMADESQYQIWIERVDSSGKIGFVLEDGHIKGQTLPAKEDPPKAKVEDTRAETVGSMAAAVQEKPKPSLFDKDKE